MWSGWEGGVDRCGRFRFGPPGVWINGYMSQSTNRQTSYFNAVNGLRTYEIESSQGGYHSSRER